MDVQDFQHHHHKDVHFNRKQMCPHVSGLKSLFYFVGPYLCVTAFSTLPVCMEQVRKRLPDLFHPYLYINTTFTLSKLKKSLPRKILRIIR